MEWNAPRKKSNFVLNSLKDLPKDCMEALSQGKILSGVTRIRPSHDMEPKVHTLAHTISFFWSVLLAPYYYFSIELLTGIIHVRTGSLVWPGNGGRRLDGDAVEEEAANTDWLQEKLALLLWGLRVRWRRVLDRWVYPPVSPEDYRREGKEGYGMWNRIWRERGLNGI